MLILSRKASECIHLGDDIVLTIVAVGNDKVRIGVQAPPGVKILRTELELDATIPMKMPEVKLLEGTFPTESQPAETQADGKQAAEKLPTVKLHEERPAPLASLVKQVRRAA